MKKLIYFAFAAASALLLAACAKTDEQQAHKGRVVTLSASIEEDEETKASVSDAGILTWVTGDQIGVWTSNGVVGKFTRFDLKSGESGKATAEFTGTPDAGYNVVAGPVVYPYRAAHSYNADTQELTFNQPAAMDFQGGDATKSHMATMYGGTGTISLKQLSGLIRFTVYNVPSTAGYIRLKTTDKTTSGNFVVDMSAETPTIVASDASGDQYFNLNFSSSSPENVVGKKYVASFPVPVATYGYLRVSVQETGGDMIGFLEKNKKTSITRGKMVLMPEVTIKAVNLADNEDGNVRDNFNKTDYENGYKGSITTDATLSVVDNPLKTVTNASKKVLSVTASSSGGNSGLIDILTKVAFDSDPVAYYPTNYKSGIKAFTVKVRYFNSSDKTKYYPRAVCREKDTPSEFGLPNRINGEYYDGTVDEWERLMKADDWNVLQWTLNTSGVYRIDIKPFLTFEGENQTSVSSRIMYFDDFRFLK